MTRLASVLAVVLVLGLAVGVAQADQTIVGAPVDMFVNSNVTISQGEKVTFTNTDTADHDVTAEKKDANGKPVFQSARTGTGQSSPVTGVESLAPGTYDFYCSIHIFMKGTITVTGSSSGGGQPSGSGSADKTPPSVSVKVLDTRRAAVRKRRSLQLSVTTNEPVTVRLKATSGSATFAAGSATLTKAGTRKLTIKLTKAGLRATKRPGPVKIKVTAAAKDAAGNGSTASATGKLR